MDDITQKLENATSRRSPGGRDESKMAQPIKHGCLVRVTEIIIVQRATAEGQDGKMNECPAPHNFPRIVFKQVGEVLPRRGFLLLRWRFDALTGGKERNQEQHEAKDRPNRHCHVPAILLI